MPRNSTGKYFLPSGNPVSSGEVIASEWANKTLSDIATALSDSLDREGSGGMKAPIKLSDGTQSAPGMGFTNESNTGFYRPADRTVAMVVGGVEVATVTQSGMQLKAAKQLMIPQAPVDASDAANKTYVDTAASNTESSAKTYADTAASTAQSNAESYADTAASNAESSAKTYADGVLNDAKTYADGVLDDAKSYTDTAKSESESYAASQASTAQSNAESYADGKFAEKNQPLITRPTAYSLGGDALYLSGGDHVYLSFFPFGTGGQRGGYIGFAQSGFTNITYFNDLDGGHVFRVNGGSVALRLDKNADVFAINNAYKPGGGTWGDSSDARLKYNIQPLESALDKIMALKPVSYEWQVDRPDATTVGFIAQEVERVFPNAVSEVEPQDDETDLVDDKTKTIGWKSDFFAYLVGAIQDQQAQIEALQARVKDLEGNS